MYNLSIISGLRIGPKLITASALDSLVCCQRYWRWRCSPDCT